jgi:hypothetical protein
MIPPPPKGFLPAVQELFNQFLGKYLHPTAQVYPVWGSPQR